MANVSYPSEVLAKLRRWGDAALRAGLRDSFVTALRVMEDRLRVDPEAWGDPLWDYRELHLTFYQRLGPVLLVHYTVHIDGTPAFVQDVRLTPGSPLANAAE